MNIGGRLTLTNFLFNAVSLSGTTLQNTGMGFPAISGQRITFAGTLFFEINGLGAGLDFQIVPSAGAIFDFGQKLLLYQTFAGLQGQNIDNINSIFQNVGITGTRYAMDVSGWIQNNGDADINFQMSENVAAGSVVMLAGSFLNFWMNQ